MQTHLCLAKKNISTTGKNVIAVKVVNLQKMAARMIPLILWHRNDQ
jgi:hypothetical protein